MSVPQKPSLHLSNDNIKSKVLDFQGEFNKLLNKKKLLLPYSELITEVYETVNYQPILVTKFLPEENLQILFDYLEKSDQHGLDTNLFYIPDIKEKLAAFNASKTSDSLKTYQNLVKLELATVTALIRYSMILQFGLVNPGNIYTDTQYSTPTLQADSITIMHVFEIKDLKKYLDSIQPKSPTYIKLQKALLATNENGSTATDEIRESLIVNLERLRWKNRPADEKYVSVNIPSFSLDVINKGKSMLQMRVCVGEKGQWETPQLGSMIFRIQVNPVWNIPQSIARNETSKNAAQDRYYLSNSNIKVYKKGVLIRNSESINWSTANLDEYSFQQQPGVENALGKIKFLFENKSSVYLHDTPHKVFNQPMRAISHGCVRVQKPLELADVLFDKSPKYQLIKNAMANGYPRAKFIDLPQQVPIRIDYYTIGVDTKGTIHYYKDIYELDPILYKAITKQF
ncbi:MAG: L,D-transpeptidase family protein [Pedobacter sp.]|uniref:L,D-transpeptidase family protein n=1 Tax=Pedobacter sp. TaxID=1411316 RepID=UPI00356A2B10